MAKGLVNKTIESAEKINDEVVITYKETQSLDSHLVEIEELEKEINQANENITYHTKIKEAKEQELADKQAFIAGLK